MSDPLDLANLVTPVGSALGGAGIIGAFMKWAAGKESEALATRLALMEQKLDQLIVGSEKHEMTGERVALLEQSVKNLSGRLDALVAEPPRRRGR